MRYVCLLIFAILGLVFAGFILGVTWAYSRTVDIQIDDGSMNYVPSGYYLQHWYTLSELHDWLEKNTVSQALYVKDDFDCDDFAIQLSLAAAQDGKFIGLRTTKTHMANWAIVGNMILAIEPQNDAYSQWRTKLYGKVDR